MQTARFWGNDPEGWLANNDQSVLLTPALGRTPTGSPPPALPHLRRPCSPAPPYEQEAADLIAAQMDK